MENLTIKGERMRRFTLATVVGATAITAVVGTVSVANAADNDKSFVGTYSYTTTEMCTDPVHVEGVYDEMVHIFYNNDGEAIRASFTGKVTVTYTDEVSGSTFNPNSSGPGTVDLLTGQAILRGSNGFVVTDQGVVSTHGRLVLDGDGTVISMTGNQTGVCAALGTTGPV